MERAQQKPAKLYARERSSTVMPIHGESRTKAENPLQQSWQAGYGTVTIWIT
jgi:hypothetical protein